MKSVTELMSTEVEMVDVNWSVLQVIALMKDKKIGSVIVERDGKIIGIFTERDLLTRVDLTRPTGIISVGITDVMTPTVITIDANQSLTEVVTIMRKHGVRHLPVLDGSQIVGVVSSRDLLEHYQMYLEQTISETKEQFATNLRNSRSSQKRFREVFSRAKIGVVVTNTKGNITSWNRFAGSILGESDITLEGASMNLFFPDDQWEKTIKTNIALSEKNEHPYYLETKLYCNISRPIKVALSVGAAKDKTGKVFGAVHIIAPLDET